MSGPETTFIKSVHAHLPHDLYRIKNNNMYHAGIADVWYSGKRGDLWIEYKFIVVPKLKGTIMNLVDGKPPVLSYLQQEWLESRHLEGRTVGVIVGCKAGGVWYPQVSWRNSQTVLQYEQNLKSRKDLAALLKGLTV